MLIPMIGEENFTMQQALLQKIALDFIIREYKGDDMNKNKKIRIAIIIISVITVILLINWLRNFLIIKSLSKNKESYCADKEYHFSEILKYKSEIRKEEIEETYDIYRKREKYAELHEYKNLDAGITSKSARYGKGYNMHAYSFDTKTVFIFENWDEQLDDKYPMIDYPCSFMDIFTVIIPINVEGKKCYKCQFMFDYLIIEKETGLLIQSFEDNKETNISYDFNNVKDSIFTEPKGFRTLN